MKLSGRAAGIAWTSLRSTPATRERSTTIPRWPMPATSAPLTAAGPSHLPSRCARSPAASTQSTARWPERAPSGVLSGTHSRVTNPTGSAHCLYLHGTATRALCRIARCLVSVPSGQRRGDARRRRVRESYSLGRAFRSVHTGGSPSVSSRIHGGSSLRSTSIVNPGNCTVTRRLRLIARWCSIGAPSRQARALGSAVRPRATDGAPARSPASAPARGPRPSRGLDGLDNSTTSSAPRTTRCLRLIAPSLERSCPSRYASSPVAFTIGAAEDIVKEACVLFYGRGH